MPRAPVGQGERLLGSGAPKPSWAQSLVSRHWSEYDIMPLGRCQFSFVTPHWGGGAGDVWLWTLIYLRPSPAHQWKSPNLPTPFQGMSRAKSSCFPLYSYTCFWKESYVQENKVLTEDEMQMGRKRLPEMRGSIPLNIGGGVCRESYSWH